MNKLDADFWSKLDTRRRCFTGLQVFGGCIALITQRGCRAASQAKAGMMARGMVFFMGSAPDIEWTFIGHCQIVLSRR
ncbi:protein of unknown function [Acidithiobacillus ferrivorans]|uniref:TfoX N-terminal domain-containing protein n=1 Tax=Acidithiobacillus ferrivorans TaxID=160808 RepID=A0ABY1MNE3_9PROT|nr:protein of unknown function [Acidithiobacillus ferrivorans]